MRKFSIHTYVIVYHNGIFISWPHMYMQMRVWYRFFVKII